MCSKPPSPPHTSLVWLFSIRSKIDVDDTSYTAGIVRLKLGFQRHPKEEQSGYQLYSKGRALELPRDVKNHTLINKRILFKDRLWQN